MTDSEEIHYSVADPEKLRDQTISLADVFRSSLARHPAQVITCWNWKAPLPTASF